MKKQRPFGAGAAAASLARRLSVPLLCGLSRRWIVRLVVLEEVLGCFLRVNVEHHSSRVVLGDVR